MSVPVREPRANALLPARSVVALAASAGGLHALGEVLSALPESFPAALVIVLHLSPKHKSFLAQILDRQTALQVREAGQGDCLRDGLVFVAPPDRHLLVGPGGILSLSTSEKVHFCRPAADPLFASVAAVYGQRAVGVVLTGGDGDGSRGLQAVKAAGGRTIAQDAATSQNPSMPRSAAGTGDVNFVLPLCQIGPSLVELLLGANEKV